MSELLDLALRLNLAVAAAVVGGLALRWPARHLFGPRVAYGVWLLAPFSAVAMLVPARVVTVTAERWSPAPASAWPIAPSHVLSAGNVAPADLAVNLPVIVAAIWFAGAVVAAVRLIRRQLQFVRTERAGAAGPAVVGVLNPRIVLPADFADRYTGREQALILRHELTHLARQDSRVNAAVAVVRCLCWFNPAVHALAHVLRIDQELACDAQVAAAHPGSRRAYAEAMLKTQLAAAPVPLGCHWPASGLHPLAQRIALLARPAPGRLARTAGVVCVGLTAAAGAWSAWAARPPEFVWAPAPVRSTPTDAAWAEAPAPAPAPAAPSTHAEAPRAPAAWAKPKRTADAEPGLAPADPLPLTPVSAATAPPEGCGQVGRSPPGDFGPARRIHSFARHSSVEPGQAVRIYAATTALDGTPLVTDLTAFGSQQAFRVGCIRRNLSADSLFTSVVQQGDRLRVELSIRRDDRWVARGAGDLAPGETKAIPLDDGRTVLVTAVVRPETPEEIEAADPPGPGRVFSDFARAILSS